MTASKRALDLVASILGLVLIGPLLVLIAIAIKQNDGGPVFFRQERVGRRGRLFRMWKFRTMVPDADRLGPLLTAKDDRRLTSVGAHLRRWKLDELPQLFNVIGGDMSLVGPRPEVARYVARYTPAQREVLELTPGITDPASITFRDEATLLAAAGQDIDRVYVEQIIPAKIELNLAYAREASVLKDLRVILQTLHVIGADTLSRRRTAELAHATSHVRDIPRS